MFCNKCGTAISEGTKYCPSCGSRVENANSNHVTDNINQSSAPIAMQKKSNSKALLTTGLVLSIIGIVGFLLIVFIGLMIYGRVYLFDGYDFTVALCILCIILQLSGAILLALGLIRGIRGTVVSKKKIILSIILICISLICSAILIVNAINENKPSSSSSSSYSSSSYEMDHATYCLLYMEVSNVKVTHSGNYAYISGTITNTGTYQIKYVKVRAQCKDYRGNIIDTDWTYAVDSSWLYPGESKKFEIMVKDTGKDISTATVTVVND